MGLVQEERLAFALCDRDRMVGLTWTEVAACEVVALFLSFLVLATGIKHVYLHSDQDLYADVLAAEGLEVPTEDNFHSADLNGDGTLLFAEWQHWVGNAALY